MNFFDVITPIVKPIGDYFTRRSELKSQEHQQDAAIKQAINERQCDLIKQGLAADAAWEMEFARQAASSWKDEYELLIMSVPLVLCFISTPALDGASIVKHGFDAIATTPAWFQFVFVSIFLANYGIRYWRKTQSDT
jgi:hypothetical protein